VAKTSFPMSLTFVSSGDIAMTMLPAKIITPMIISEVAFLNRTIGCMFSSLFSTPSDFAIMAPEETKH
jgi:hypothetical protein